ncbi:hypothetical protein EVAR_59471_1 [Eumeta japonica]|uniref:Uncharacterized protein n=1 Tax=Eumeta variegata TaxID=151549 RepID=A0A4C1Z0B5_EUMVA|nr:hypothetical protein EVAR_59471_1 [Eumeta japonica]
MLSVDADLRSALYYGFLLVSCVLPLLQTLISVVRVASVFRASSMDFKSLSKYCDRVLVYNNNNSPLVRNIAYLVVLNTPVEGFTEAFRALDNYEYLGIAPPSEVSRARAEIRGDALHGRVTVRTLRIAFPFSSFKAKII